MLLFGIEYSNLNDISYQLRIFATIKQMFGDPKFPDIMFSCGGGENTAS